MKDWNSVADQFVGDFIERHTKTRILDGRPDRVLTKTLTLEIGALLRSHFDVETIAEQAKEAKTKPNDKSRKAGKVGIEL